MSLKKYLSESELAAVQPITGDAFDISIRELTNIETTVLEHTEGSITIQLDETAIKLLEEAGVTFEDEQLDELAPLIGAVGGAVARGVAAGAGALARGAAKAVVGSGLKAAHDKLDKAIFGPKGAENDYEESVREQDDDEEEDYQPQVGDVVQVVYPTRHEGHFGEVVELSPSGDWVYVQFKDDDIESYHASDLRQATEQEEEEYHYGVDDEFKESITSIQKLAGMNVAEAGQRWDSTPGGPYDRGAADSYYGRPFNPHKFVDKSDGVRGERMRVKLTDPKEIAAYEAGYKENDDEKDYGRFPDYSDDMKEANDLRRLAGLPIKEAELTERPGDWAPLAANTLKAIAFLIGVPVIAMGQIWKNDLPVIDSPLGKAMYDAAARGDNYAKQELNRLEDLGVKEIPMQYLEKLSNQYLHENKLNENAEYQTLKAALTEAEYQGRKVPLNKPMQGDRKKFKVYTNNPKTGKVVKVNFGDPNMRIKKSNPARRKSFRARHNCDNPGPKTKARYWSCKAW